jgi:hypothetical protein
VGTGKADVDEKYLPLQMAPDLRKDRFMTLAVMIIMEVSVVYCLVTVSVKETETFKGGVEAKLGCKR